MTFFDPVRSCKGHRVTERPPCTSLHGPFDATPPLGGAGVWTVQLGGPDVHEGERGQQESCVQSGAGFCPSTVAAGSCQKHRCGGNRKMSDCGRKRCHVAHAYRFQRLSICFTSVDFLVASGQSQPLHPPKTQPRHAHRGDHHAALPANIDFLSTPGHVFHVYVTLHPPSTMGFSFILVGCGMPRSMSM